MMSYRLSYAICVRVTHFKTVHIMVAEGNTLERRLFMNNCLGNIFDNNCPCTWIIVIALIILLFCTCCNG